MFKLRKQSLLSQLLTTFGLVFFEGVPYLPKYWQIPQQVHRGLVFEDSFVVREVNVLHCDPGAGGAQGPEVEVTQFGNILGPD